MTLCGFLFMMPRTTCGYDVWFFNNIVYDPECEAGAPRALLTAEGGCIPVPEEPPPVIPIPDSV